MNLCYCDESGTGDEPVAVMVGIVVDAQRMHLTKSHWTSLLEDLEEITGHEITELHTRNFYSGKGIWRDMSGADRAGVITAIAEWLAERRHRIVYSSVLKTSYFAAFKGGEIPNELNTIWRFLGFHLMLAMQKHSQREKRNKGHTIFVFDNEERERVRFTDIIQRPPGWSDAYYDRGGHQERLDQIIDVPYFGDSREVSLIQLADLVSFFLRRYAEIRHALVPAKYEDEEARVTQWISAFLARSIGQSYIYPRDRDYSENLFYRHAPPAIRDFLSQ